MAALKAVAVILAAGKGTRMNASLPKVLHPILGKPMLEWSLSAGREATEQAPVVVIGPETDEIQERYANQADFIVQHDRLGTGHALFQSITKLKGAAETLLVLNADMPFIRVETLRNVLDCQVQNDGPLTILTAHDSNSRGFGRVLRDDAGEISAIEEEAHLTPEQIKITELNLGAYCIDDEWVWRRLEKLPQSPKGEYYLTDLVALAVEDGRKVEAVSISERDEIIGINTRVHLAEAEAAARNVVNQAWMLAGVTLVDPNSTYIGLEVEIGRDTIILPNTHLEGKSIIGEDCRLGPNTIIRDSRIGDRCQLEASVIEESILEMDVDAGPFCHLRPGSYLAQGVHMGNFGEVKNSTLGPGVKVGHFSYLGDTTVGAGTNIGAGTITANYDGDAKHPTEIGENVFIGSDTMLVAPVKIGDGARTGAGAVVTRDVPANSVAVGVPARVIRRDKEQNDE